MTLFSVLLFGRGPSTKARGSNPQAANPKLRLPDLYGMKRLGSDAFWRLLSQLVLGLKFWMRSLLDAEWLSLVDRVPFLFPSGKSSSHSRGLEVLLSHQGGT